jgi:hypothetical protein
VAAPEPPSTSADHSKTICTADAHTFGATCRAAFGIVARAYGQLMVAPGTVSNLEQVMDTNASSAGRGITDRG